MSVEVYNRCTDGTGALKENECMYFDYLGIGKYRTADNNPYTGDKKPHLCPKCYGNGNITYPDYLECNVCKGKGVLWG